MYKRGSFIAVPMIILDFVFINTPLEGGAIFKCLWPRELPLHAKLQRKTTFKVQSSGVACRVFQDFYDPLVYDLNTKVPLNFRKILKNFKFIILATPLPSALRLPICMMKLVQPKWNSDALSTTLKTDENWFLSIYLEVWFA